MVSYYSLSRIVTVPSKSGTKMKTAMEDVRMALLESSPDGTICDEIDVFKNTIEDCIDEVCVESVSADGDLADSQSVAHTVDDSGFDNENDKDRFILLSSVGDETEVYWPTDSVYSLGTFAAINDDGSNYHIDYDDGDKKVLDVSDEIWECYSGSIVDASNVRLGA